MTDLRTLIAHAAELRTEGDRQYIRLCSALASIYEIAPDFYVVCDEIGMHYRKAMYAVAIHRQIISRNRRSEDCLASIGWSKLSKILPVVPDTVGDDIVDAWLTLAESNTSKELAYLVSGKSRATVSVTFQLSLAAKDMLDRVLFRFGMSAVGTKTVNRDAALLSLLESVSSSGTSTTLAE